MVIELPPTAGLPLKLQDIAAGIFGAGGLQTKSFEQLLAEYLDFPELSLYASGTLCLSIAFEALKEISGRKRVIIPAYTCPLLPIAAHAAGVEVVLCDTQAGSCNLDLQILERICDRSIAAVVPTDIAGLPIDLAPIRKIASASGAYVLEDAAQALGAFINGRAAGSEADMAVYSLSVGKGLSLYDGGILAVRDPDLRQRVKKVAERRVRKQPQLNLLRLGQLLGVWLLYNPTGLAWVYGRELRHWLKKNDPVRACGEHFDLEIPAYEFDELRKRIGASALLRLPEFLQSNRRRALARREILVTELGLNVLTEVDGAEGSWPFLMVLAETGAQRDLIMEKLWQSGLGVTRLFIHDLASYDYLRGLVPEEQTPNAKSFAARSFSITNSHWLLDREFATIVRTLKTVVEAASQFSPVHQ